MCAVTILGPPPNRRIAPTGGVPPAGKPVVQIEGHRSRSIGAESRRHPLAVCEWCPLGDRGDYVPDEGPLDAPVAIVGMAPAGVELERGRPFVGPSGRILEKCLMRVGLRRDDFRIANRIGCRAPKDNCETKISVSKLHPSLAEALQGIRRSKAPLKMAAIGDAAAWCCRYRLVESIGRARVVVAMGAFTMRGFIDERSLLAVRGAVFEAPDGEVRVVPG